MTVQIHVVHYQVESHSDVRVYCRYPVPPKKELQGRTDKYIGSWLAGRTRQDVVLASKVGECTAWS